MKKSSILLLLLCFLGLSLCDVPNHCVKSQILGTWRLYMGAEQDYLSKHEVNCGHEEPDNPNTSWKALREEFRHLAYMEVVLNRNFTISIAEDEDEEEEEKKIFHEIGNWSLIYDTGFELRIGGARLFSFFDHQPAPDTESKWISNCSQTVVGWIHVDQELEQDSMSCFRAVKIDSYQQQQQNQITIEKIAEVTDDSKSNKKFLGSKFLKIDKNFKQHEDFVERLNQIPDLTWKAVSYPEFEGKTVEEINEMRGVKNQYKIELGKKPLRSSYVGDLPESIDWSNVTGKAKNQKRCGSCYVFATLNMLEARLKILYNESVSLAHQHVIDCSFYNQGCDGGFPFLVNKWAHEFELVPESCHPYKAENRNCSESCDVSKLPKVYKVKDYHQVRNSQGFTDERSLMLELLNGPVSVSFFVTPGFHSYSGGIYVEPTEEQLASVGIDREEFKPANHGVILVGWGVENGLNYWIGQNSWGTGWGEKGYFRIRRGTDELNIESDADVGIPYIKYQTQTDIITN